MLICWLFEESKQAFFAQFPDIPKQCDEVRKEEEQEEIDEEDVVW